MFFFLIFSVLMKSVVTVFCCFSEGKKKEKKDPDLTRLTSKGIGDVSRSQMTDLFLFSRHTDRLMGISHFHAAVAHWGCWYLQKRFLGILNQTTAETFGSATKAMKSFVDFLKLLPSLPTLQTQIRKTWDGFTDLIRVDTDTSVFDTTQGFSHLQICAGLWFHWEF